MSSLGVKRWSRDQSGWTRNQNNAHAEVVTKLTPALVIGEGCTDEVEKIPRAKSIEVDTVDSDVPRTSKTIEVDIIDLVIPRMSKNKMKKERSRERKRAQTAKDQDDEAAMQESLEGKITAYAAKDLESCTRRVERPVANVHQVKEEENGIPTMITNCTLKTASELIDQEWPQLKSKSNGNAKDCLNVRMPKSLSKSKDLEECRESTKVEAEGEETKAPSSGREAIREDYHNMNGAPIAELYPSGDDDVRTETFGRSKAASGLGSMEEVSAGVDTLNAKPEFDILEPKETGYIDDDEEGDETQSDQENDDGPGLVDSSDSESGEDYEGHESDSENEDEEWACQHPPIARPEDNRDLWDLTQEFPNPNMNSREAVQAHVQKTFADFGKKYGADYFDRHPPGSSVMPNLSAVMGCDVSDPDAELAAWLEEKARKNKIQKKVKFEDKPAIVPVEVRRQQLAADSGVGMIDRPTTSCGLSILMEKQNDLLAIMSQEWTEIEITIDSGACDNVMPTNLTPHISLMQNENSRRGMEYEVANGEGLPNQGEKRCVMMTENSGLAKKIVFQCADVHMALLSVSRVADLGYQCSLGKDGGELVDMVTGDKIPLHRRGNLYVMRAWVRQDEAGFVRQG